MRLSTTHVTAAISLLLLNGFSSATAKSIQAIPVDASVPERPHPVVAEGQRHFLYELHITNFGRSELTLERVDAINTTSGRTLLSVSGEALSSATSRPGIALGGNRRAIGAGQRSVVFLDVILPASARPPVSLGHRLTFAPMRTIDLQDETIIDVNSVPVSRAAPILLGAPLRGGCWVASHALSNDSVHRRTIIALNGHAYDAQRYAIDWIRIGDDGQAFRNDPANNRNWSAYGADVLAVADGTVAEARDGIPENDPTTDKKAVPIDLETVGGNHILMRLSGGQTIFYAHLQPGSVRVHAGDHVSKGEVIGRIGNSGQADAPHLHIHVTDGPSALANEGIPMEFSSFVLQGHLPSLSVLANGQGWRPSGPPTVRRNEMPTENAVVAFPGGDSPCTRR